ncbi:MAG: hypothetical protein Q7U41_00755 [Microbacterium sp.]|nr:hypothetical protein [Microbacterium sp.]
MSVEVPPERARATQARIKALRREHTTRVLNGIFGTITVLVSIATVAGIAVAGLLLTAPCPVPAPEPLDLGSAATASRDVVIAGFEGEVPVRFDEHSYRRAAFVVGRSLDDVLPAGTELTVMLRDYEPQLPPCAPWADSTPVVPDLEAGSEYILFVQPTPAEAAAQRAARDAAASAEGDGGKGGGTGGRNQPEPPAATDSSEPRRVLLVADAAGAVLWTDPGVAIERPRLPARLLRLLDG